jgi:hypothetical protein
VRFRFALFICFLLITPILPVSAQDEPWLGVTATTGVGINGSSKAGNELGSVPRRNSFGLMKPDLPLQPVLRSGM